jgi:DUF1680 family protein
LLGAQAPAGDNWCYYSFPNGKRVYTTYWRCCKSSGPWALEELPPVAYGVTPEGHVAINLYGPGEATLPTPAAGAVRIKQDTRYPYEGDIHITVRPERTARFSLHLRIPGWADAAVIQVNGRAFTGPASANTYAAIERDWQPGDVVTVSFAMPLKLHRQVNRNIQESRAPDGSPVCQEVLHFDYAAITRGPLVYATGLIDGFKIEETIRLPHQPEGALELLDAPAGSEARAVRLNLGGRPPITFLPYVDAGSRTDGAWRLTWLQVAPDNPSPT